MQHHHLAALAITRHRIKGSVTARLIRHLSDKRNVSSSPSTSYLEPTHIVQPSEATSITSTTLETAAKYLLPVYARPPFVLEKGKGSWLQDHDGRKWLDFTAGIAVNALGHADEGVVHTISSQAAKLIHASNVYHNDQSAQLAKSLVELTRLHGGLGNAANSPATTEAGIKVFFSNSGTEANEAALKIARKVGRDRGAQKQRIVCFHNAFHGRTMGALSVTPNEKYQAPFAPLVPQVDVGYINDVAALDTLISDETCGVMVEPIQGEGGIHEANEDWLRQLRGKCDKHGAVLIFDEIQCGLFRTGRMWAHSDLPVHCHPDVVTMAKPLANGFPIGAVMLRDSISSTMTAGSHGTTFGGSPLACAVGLHVLTRISQPEFISTISDHSAYLDARLGLLPQWFPHVLHPHVRGRGFIRGLGFKDHAHPGKVMEKMRERGVFVLTAGKDAVRLVPSLNVSKDEIDLCVDVLESVLSSTL